MADENMMIKQAIETGEVWVGARRTEKAVKSKAAKMLVLASNCPEFGWLKAATVRIRRYAGTSLDLGAACGKPFPVSVLVVLDPGGSGILSL